jgi:uncharacterized protein YhaN
MEQWAMRYERRNDELNVINGKIFAQRQEMRVVATAIEQRAQALGIRMPSAIDDLDTIAEQLGKEQNRGYDLDSRQDEEKRALRERDECLERRNRLENELTVLNKKLRTASEGWRTWLAQNRFVPGLAPERFDSFLTRARDVCKDLESLNVLRGKVRRCEEYMASFDKRVRVLSGTIGLSLDRENRGAIFRSLKEALELKARMEESFEVQRLLKLEHAEAEKEMASVIGKIEASYKDAGVENEAEYRALVKECERRASMETRLSELRRALAISLGEEALNAPLDSDIFSDFCVRNEKIEELRLTVAEGENALDALNADISILESQVTSVIADDRLFTLKQKNETLRNQGRKLLKNWLLVVLAKDFATKAMERHKKNRRPEIVRDAQQIFSLMTPTRKKAIGMEDVFFEMQKKQKSNGERNWGLTDQVCCPDQLYLSLRLAMACHWGRRSESVPIILDGVLARFDDRRQREIMEALWWVSEKIQVVLLTCHRFTAEMFRSRLANEEGFAMIEVPRVSGKNAIAPPKARAHKNAKR